MIQTKARVTLVGNYLDSLERPLRQKGILLDCIIPSCSPLAMVGTQLPGHERYLEDINLPMPTVLNIRKNLPTMLSRDESRFNQNYNLQPYSKNIRYKNETDYFVLTNSSMGYALFTNGDAVYSDTWPQNAFITDIKADKAFTRQSFPFREGLNWKHYYDQFIDAVLAEYDREHIILIRTHSSGWFMDGQQICTYDEKSLQYRKRIEEMDEYFLSRTRCRCLNTQYHFIPDKNTACAFTYSPKGAAMLKQLEKEISAIIEGGQAGDPYPSYTGDPAVCRLLNRLSRDLLQENAGLAEKIQKDGLSFPDLSRKASENKFFQTLLRLDRFLNQEKHFDLSNYTCKLLAKEGSLDGVIAFETVECYAGSMRLDLSDVISIYQLYSRCRDKKRMLPIFRAMLRNTDCLPVQAARRLRNRNQEFLKNYPYLLPELKEVSETERVFIRIENGSYFLLNFSEEDYFQKLDLTPKKPFDPMEVIEQGYYCPIESAWALCSSYAFYIERAKRSEGNRPVKIEFESADEFSDSLMLYDYSDLLTNENFVITLAGKKVSTAKFKAICDLSFLVKKDAKICEIRSGLCDQIRYYVFSRKLEEEHSSGLGRKAEVYYDDTVYLYTCCFNGLEVDRFGTKDISDRLLSNLLSNALKAQITGNSRLPELLYKNGLTDTVMVSVDGKRIGEYKQCNRVYCPIKSGQYPDSIIKKTFDFNPVFYRALIEVGTFGIGKRFDLNDYIRFPDFDERNRSVAQEMLSCDAVAIQIRLGDFVRVGFDVDNGFYGEAIQELLGIPDYPNKKYFVFSDNIPYVREHAKEYGLDLLESTDIWYIDHNKNEDSFRDLQLMSLAKVMIVSGSGLCKTAFLMSKRCEQFFNWNMGVLGTFEKIGRKNKYKMKMDLKKYHVDMSQWKPKESQK